MNLYRVKFDTIGLFNILNNTANCIILSYENINEDTVKKYRLKSMGYEVEYRSDDGTFDVLIDIDFCDTFSTEDNKIIFSFLKEKLIIQMRDAKIINILT